MNTQSIYEKGQNLIIKENLHQLKFIHICIACGKNFRVLGPDGIEIPTTQEERNALDTKIDNIHYTDSHGICDECDERLG